MANIVRNFAAKRSPIAHKYMNHAFPSFKLLYLMDEVMDPSLVVYAEDFTNEDDEFIEFDSYIVPESDLEEGQFRMLEVDNRVIIPELTHTRFVISAADVIHSYACPSLGIKADAYPGRLNQASVYVNRPGTFFGQCSEICGILHSSMPIAIQSVSIRDFLL
ncbi:cytochrome c oxidase subunit II [Melampsora americana]|nr:cytochrome c oxidase subunit II [Melampsora americana]KAH9806719.1 cytochrome c oxidase subunit II [Melampsora americana]